MTRVSDNESNSRFSSLQLKLVIGFMVTLKGTKLTLFIYLSLLSSILGVFLVSSFWPSNVERFFELGLLGRNGRAEDYFLGDDSTVQINSNLPWYLYVRNRMGSEQLILIRVTLINSTMQTPNDTSHEPSLQSALTEFPLSLARNETVVLPFTWKITETQFVNDAIRVRQVMINDLPPIDTDISSSDNKFALVFELWVYHPSTGRYEFSWETESEPRSASVYIWFDLAS